MGGEDGLSSQRGDFIMRNNVFCIFGNKESIKVNDTDKEEVLDFSDTIKKNAANKERVKQERLEASRRIARDVRRGR